MFCLISQETWNKITDFVFLLKTKINTITSWGWAGPSSVQLHTRFVIAEVKCCKGNETIYLLPLTANCCTCCHLLLATCYLLLAICYLPLATCHLTLTTCHLTLDTCCHLLQIAANHCHLLPLAAPCCPLLPLAAPHCYLLLCLSAYHSAYQPTCQPA